MGWNRWRGCFEIATASSYDFVWASCRGYGSDCITRSNVPEHQIASIGSSSSLLAAFSSSPVRSLPWIVHSGKGAMAGNRGVAIVNEGGGSSQSIRDEDENAVI